MTKGFTVSEAAHKWVREFNAIPQGMIEKLIAMDCEGWAEVTAPAVGDRVYVYDESAGGEIAKRIGETYIVKLDNNDEEIECSEDDFEAEYDYGLPMWGTMWNFGDSCDDWWLENEDGIEIMSSCGFRIYKSEEFGYFFGIDGAGYDFYEAHWIPLYKARGLQWHDPETEKEAKS